MNLIKAKLNTDQTKEWEDGKTYPYYPLDVSSASHPFYTGKHKIVDTGGRVDRFKKRFAKTTPAVKSEANDSSEEETVEALEEVTETPVEEVQEDISEAPTEEAAQEETSKDKE